MLLMLGGAVAASALLASAYTFREFKVAPAEKLFTPIGPDSLQKENPFKAEDLLKARAILPDAEAAGCTTVVAQSQRRGKNLESDRRLAAPGRRDDARPQPRGRL